MQHVWLIYCEQVHNNKFRITVEFLLENTSNAQNVLVSLPLIMGL
jgi:hypothetical protein